MNPADAATPLPPAWLELPDGRTHWIEGTCTIGRLTNNQLVLNHPGVSRNHAVVQPDPHGGHVLADLRSTNGTFLNGRRLESATLLRDTDRLVIGDLTLTYRCNTAHAPAEPGTANNATSIQIHQGACWLVLFDVIGFTALTHQLGNEAASQRVKDWIGEIRPIVVRHGGTINAYQGDAVFAYWRADMAPPARVLRALREARELQTRSALPFRIICHHGTVRVSGGLGGENLDGSEVIFLFRIEKSTKHLGSACVLSDPAATSLDAQLEARFLGEHAVPDFPGRHAFYELRLVPTAPAGASHSHPASGGNARPGAAPLPSSAAPHASALAAATGADGPAPGVPGSAQRRILVIEEHSLVGDGIVAVLSAQGDLRVVGRASAASVARQLHQEHQPDLVLLDLSTPGDALTLIRDLLAADADTRLVVLAPPDAAPDLAERAVRAGALGCIARADPTSELLRALRLVLDGGVYLSRRYAVPMLRALTAGAAAPGVDSATRHLSDRETEIFRLVGLGRQNKDIAASLGVSVKTIEAHKENMKVKLSITTAAELVALARAWVGGK